MSTAQKTIVILLSDKRSGSTMLQDVLCQHPDIQTVAYSPHTYLETHHWLKGAVLLKPESCHYSGYGSTDNARTYLIDSIKGNLPEFKLPETDRELVFKGWEALCERFAHPVFFEKSPQYLGQPASVELLLEWIHQTDYTVKVIGLTRNPLSVQYSAWKLFHRDPENRQFGWAEIQRTLLRTKDKLRSEQFLNLRYEDLIASPVEQFREICSFIGVSTDHEISTGVHDRSLIKWKEDPYFTVRLDESVKLVAREFGYTDEELDNPVKARPPASYRLRKKAETILKLSRAHFIDRIQKPLLLKVKNRKND